MSTIRADVLSAANGTSATTLTGQVAAKSWSTFNGNNASVYGSFNVSSITRIGTGQYYVNMSNAMVDSNYNAIAGSGNAVGNFSTGFCATHPSSTSVQYIGKYVSGFQDDTYIFSTVLR